MALILVDLFRLGVGTIRLFIFVCLGSTILISVRIIVFISAGIVTTVILTMVALTPTAVGRSIRVVIPISARARIRLRT